jgi:hypothetical protein
VHESLDLTFWKAMTGRVLDGDQRPGDRQTVAVSVHKRHIDETALVQQAPLPCTNVPGELG